MPFEYATSGLPENDRWQIATEICNQWLNQNMSMFGPERIASFMHNQPVAAAKRIIEHCADYSDESVALALLGPAKASIIANPETEKAARNIFGDRTVDLLQSMANPTGADAEMLRDATRIFIVEGISTMSDQMIGRAKIDRFHETRWNILNDLERNFATVKGDNPGLDALFEDAAKKSHEALTALDKAERSAGKKGFKPPVNPH